MSTRNNHQIPFLAFLFIFLRSLVEQKNHVRFPFVIAIEKVEGIPHKDYNNLKYTERVLTGITWMLIKYKLKKIPPFSQTFSLFHYNSTMD